MKKIRYFIAFGLACTILFLSILASTPSYAWIYFQKSTVASDFTIGEGVEITLEQSSYSEGQYQFAACTVSENDAYAGVYNGSFNFGKIDNVVTLKPDNIVYLRLTIPAGAGDTVNFSLSYDQSKSYTIGSDTFYERYTFYKGERTDNDSVAYTAIHGGTELDSGNTAHVDIFSKLNAVEDNTTNPLPFISFQHCFSNSTTIPDDSMFEDHAHYITTNNTSNEAEMDADLLSGTVYLYIKLTPNLDAYVEAVNYIFNYMPCILDFNIRASFDVD